MAQALGPGKGLAGLMDIARAQARATGQDVNYLFDSLVMGVKRGTPLLIDNTGLVLKVSDANERFARSLGKTVGALTAEKQIALLNATLEAGWRRDVRPRRCRPPSASPSSRPSPTRWTSWLSGPAIFNYLLATQTFVVPWCGCCRIWSSVICLANALFGP